MIKPVPQQQKKRPQTEVAFIHKQQTLITLF